MIAGYFHQGSGLGNQLHRYIATRCLALDKGYPFGMANPELFKGSSFLNLYMGSELPDGFMLWNEKKITENGIDIRAYDPDINFVENNTLIDGEFQDQRYFEHRMDEVKDWLRVEPLDMSDDICVISFRGGEYVGVPDLFLPKEYWEKAISIMRKKYPTIRFEVHTDDVTTAQRFFPDFVCLHDMGLNWRSIRYAKHLILSNSSFAILPALLGEAKEVIAPLHWAGYQKGYWQLPQNYYKQFTYIHHATT